MWRKLRRTTKPCERPVKAGCARRRRIKNQKKRLVALGVAGNVVARMDTSQIREMLKRPGRIKPSGKAVA